MTSLPYGRGARAGPDSHVAQTEAYQLRERAITPTVGTALHPGRPLAHGGGIELNQIYPLKTTRIVALQIEPNDVVLSEVRIRVAIAQPSSSIRACLYVKSANGTNLLRKVAPTDAVFDTTTTGIKTSELQSTVRIPGNTLTYLAAYVDFSGTSPSLLSFQYGISATVFPLRELLGENFPVEFTTNGLQSGTDHRMPFVCYLSPDIAEVL